MNHVKRDYDGFIYKAYLRLLLMSTTPEPFTEAWQVLKAYPPESNFTVEEKQIVMSTILKMMMSGNTRLEEEAGLLFQRYANLQQ